jgi:hypothetical protein
MLGDTFTITLGGSGGTEKVLPKINQDGYSAEYILRESTQEFAAKVSHSKKSGRDRHYVEIKQTVFATANDDEYVYTCSDVILADPTGDATVADDLQQALNYVLDSTTVTKVLGWES